VSRARRGEQVVATTVTTRQGRARGKDLDDVVCFAGLPYASAPDPARPRFSLPVAPPSWKGIRDATMFGPVAPQPQAGPGYVPGEASEQAEECRTCNVWAPKGDHEGLPVMVFIHGGAFVTGSGSSVLYRGEHLARRKAVVVTFNYRLGALGFLAHEELRQAGGGCGNWGLADQLAALAYVVDHAAVFGGDPANVTVFGESAGAMSVCALLGMPAARGLFGRAIVQSGSAVAHRLSTVSVLAEELASMVGCGAPTAEALAKVPIEEVLAAQAELVARVDGGLGVPFAPVVDGGLLEAHPAELVARGKGTTQADLLVGTNRDELRFFTYLSSAAKNLDAARLVTVVGGYLRSAGLDSSLANEVVATYHQARSARGEPVEPANLLDAIGTDFIFRVPELRLLEAHRCHGARGYAYQFDWPSPFAGGVLGACHALELPFVFGSLVEPIVGLFSGTGDDAVDLSARMQEAWVAFATTGDPSTASLGEWPTYEPPTRSTMVFGASPPQIAEGPMEAERSFWEPHLGRFGIGGPIEGVESPGVAFLDADDTPPRPEGS